MRNAGTIYPIKTRCGFVLCAAMLLWMQVARAGDSDVNITCEKKRLEIKTDENTQSHSDASRKTEQWAYTVTVENQGFKPLAALEVRYIIYFKHQELGVKGEGRKETKSGTYAIASVDSLGKTSFDTDSVTLTKASLVGPVGGYTYFVNGARPNAQDTLTGLWVRIYQGGNLFAEYAYPAGLTSSEKWQ